MGSRFSDLLKKAGPWVRGPKGGTRRRLRSGKWEYKTKDKPKSKPRRKTRIPKPEDQSKNPRLKTAKKFDLHPALPAEPGKKTGDRRQAKEKTPAGKVHSKVNEGHLERDTASDEAAHDKGAEASKEILSKGHYSVVTIADSIERTDSDFDEKFNALSSELSQLGLSHTAIEEPVEQFEKGDSADIRKGRFSQKELSFFVVHGGSDGGTSYIVYHETDSERELVRDLSARYEQECVIHFKGGECELHYVLGEYEGRVFSGSLKSISKVERDGGDLATRLVYGFDLSDATPEDDVVLKAEDDAELFVPQDVTERLDAIFDLPLSARKESKFSLEAHDKMAAKKKEQTAADEDERRAIGGSDEL